MNRAGGNATSGGVEFQAAVTAWYFVAVLAEQEVAPPFDLPASTTLEAIRSETTEPVDDLLVTTSDGGFIFGQCKHSLSLSTKPTSELASVVDQFVRQYLANRATPGAGARWQRPLDAGKDRLVIFVGPRTPDTIVYYIPNLITKIAGLAGRSIQDAPTNDREAAALAALSTHITTAWRSAMGHPPAENDLRDVLSLIRVQVFDFEGQATHLNAAREILRRTILSEPAQDEAAWDHLSTLAVSLATNRAAADRNTLQASLAGAGIRLRAPRSFQQDIERLRAYSSECFALMQPLSEISFHNAKLKIARACTTDLWNLARSNSLLVTGEPGAGKSGVLYEIAARARAENVDCVLLLADRSSAPSLDRLKTDLGLSHSLPDVLAAWTSSEPALLVIDALDAAREEKAARTIRDLIERIDTQALRWRIVASIRKFDLRYGHELRRHFVGRPSQRFTDPEFSAVRHLNVPRLTDDDLDQLSRQAPQLADLIHEAPPNLKDLLRSPFNIRLVADLLTSGVQLAELTPYRTQLELLDRYWNRRVIGSSHADTREALLRAACEQMLNARSMQVERADLPVDALGALDSLLSSQVLTEWQSESGITNRYLLSYSHHVLHDYAVARLLLRGTTKSVLTRLKDRDFSLFARPSISLHFQHLWVSDRARFWEQTFELLETPGSSRLAHIVPAATVAEHFSVPDDLAPLCALLENAHSKTQAAFELLNHLVGAIITNGTPLTGEVAAPWSAIVRRLSNRIGEETATPLRILLLVALDSSVPFTVEQLGDFGAAARLLLSFAWRELPEGSNLTSVAIQGVCRTFKSNPEESDRLLRTLISSEHIKTRGYLELRWLAKELPSILQTSPTLTRDIYIAGFAYRETSERHTVMSESRLFGLASNREQDYDSALWSLGENFPAFLATALIEATHAVASAIRSYVSQKHSHDGETDNETPTFELLSTQVPLVPDISEIWDSDDTDSHENAVRLLDAFDRHVRQLDAAGDIDSLNAVLAVLVADRPPAVFWRRMLAIATDGTTLVNLIAPLLWSPTILLGNDTAYRACELLQARFSSLREEVRARIEEAILAIADQQDPERRPHAERHRDRLLGCLDESALTHPETKRILADLRATNRVPDNEPRFRSGWFTGDDSEEHHLERIGISLSNESNQALVALASPVREFNDRFLNSIPGPADVAAVAPHIVTLFDALRSLPPPPIDDESGAATLRDFTWGRLASVCAAIVMREDFRCDDSFAHQIRAALLAASRNDQPEFDQGREDAFERSPSWGTPAARIDAARGLLALVTRRDCISQEVVDAITRLSDDDVASVRFQVAAHILVFYEARPEFVWSFATSVAEKERNRGVLLGLVRSLARLPNQHADAVAKLLARIRERTSATGKSDELTRATLTVLVRLYIAIDHPLSRSEIQSVLNSLASDPMPAGLLLHSVRPALANKKDDVRRRAFYLYFDALRRAQAAADELEAHMSRPFSEWPPEKQELGRGIVAIIKGVSEQVYFGSGAFEDERAQADPRRAQEETSDAERLRRFYQEAGPLLDALADVSDPAAAHHLVETLAFLAPLDPRENFLRIARSVRASKAGGYQFESLGASLVVRVSERYLAEYRHLFRDDPECRAALLELLETFVIAGWPSARRLVYRLDEIFR